MNKWIQLLIGAGAGYLINTPSGPVAGLVPSSISNSSSSAVANFAVPAATTAAALAATWGNYRYAGYGFALGAAVGAWQNTQVNAA